MAIVDPLHIVRDLEPLILRHAATAEDNRKMAPEVMAALVDTGLLRMWIPQALGGLEMAPNAALAVMEALARIDAATGWVVSNCVFITTLYQFLPTPVIKALLGDPKAVTCGSFVPPGTAHATGDGYRVTGNWTFGSASHYATSLVVLTALTDANGPVMGADGAPVSVLAFFTPRTSPSLTPGTRWGCARRAAPTSRSPTCMSRAIIPSCSAPGKRRQGHSPRPSTA